MKKVWSGSHFPIILLTCVMIFVYGGIYAQGETGLTRQQRLQMANEHYAKGKAFNQQGDYAKANEEFKKAQDLLAGVQGGQAERISAVAPLSLMEQTSQEKQSKQETKYKPKQAKVKVPVVPEEAQKDADNYFRQGLYFARKGQTQEAIDAYKKAIELTPDNANLYYNLAIEYLKINKFQEAAEMFKTVTELNPKEKDAYYNLGVLYESYIGDKDMAKLYYTKYLKFATKADEIKEVKGWIAQIDKEKKELR